MHYLVNLRNKVLMNQILPDTLFNPKCENEKDSYTKSKR